MHYKNHSTTLDIWAGNGVHNESYSPDDPVFHCLSQSVTCVLASNHICMDIIIPCICILSSFMLIDISLIPVAEGLGACKELEWVMPDISIVAPKEPDLNKFVPAIDHLLMMVAFQETQGTQSSFHTNDATKLICIGRPWHNLIVTLEALCV